jgi:hypothetical protein
MKTPLKTLIVILLLLSCSPGKNAQKGIYSYAVSRYIIEDAREYDEYPNIGCQLDYCNMEEFTNELQGLPRFKRRKSNIETPLLTTSFNDIMRSEVEHVAEMDADKTLLTCRIKITCIGFTTDSCLMTSVTGKLFSKDGSLFAEGRGSSLMLISNQDTDWNNQITRSVKNAVNDCVKRMLRRM